MNHDYPVLECDVLVVGGGSAGVMAGIRAKEVAPDQEVIVLEKGDAKYSGCIARGMDALNIVAVPGLVLAGAVRRVQLHRLRGDHGRAGQLSHGRAVLAADAEADRLGSLFPDRRERRLRSASGSPQG